MMNYIDTPLRFINQSNSYMRIECGIEETTTMLDKLVELIIFTPRGNFYADPDFGFEYWNHEYSNVHYRKFNNEHIGSSSVGVYNEITKAECQESIRQSLATYGPQLKQVSVSIELEAAETGMSSTKKVFSRYMITIIVEGAVEDGLGTTSSYKKCVSFLMEPTVKKYKV